MAKHQPADTERNGPARPPWLPAEERRSGWFRGRRGQADDESAPQPAAAAPVSDPDDDAVSETAADEQQTAASGAVASADVPAADVEAPEPRPAPLRRFRVTPPLQPPAETSDELTVSESAELAGRHALPETPSPTTDFAEPEPEPEPEPELEPEPEPADDRFDRQYNAPAPSTFTAPEPIETVSPPTDLTTPPPAEPDIAPPADDEDAIEARAAALMAAMARHRSGDDAPEPAAPPALAEVPQPLAEQPVPEPPVPAAEPDPEPQPVPEPEAVPQAPEPESQAPEPESQAPIEEPARRPSRRMALPPWQMPATAIAAEFDSRLDAPTRSENRVDAAPPVPQAPPPPAPPEPRRQQPPPGPAFPSNEAPAPQAPPVQPVAPQPISPQAGPPQQAAPQQQAAPPQQAAPHPTQQQVPPADNRTPPPGWIPPQDQGPPPGWVPPQQQQGPPPGWVPPPEWGPPPGWVPPVDTVPPDYLPPQRFHMPPSLDEAELINRGRYAPQSGWRRAVHNATSGYVNPGDSRRDRARDELLDQIRQPIVGDFRIAVLSIKGGVGKTTTTLGLGSALAMVRADRVIAVDANPDRGTLAERISDTSTTSTVRDLLRDPNISRYADVRNHTRMSSSRLEILASEQDPAVAEVFGEADYRRTVEILRNYYNVILTDCGTGIMHSAMSGVLDLAHTIVLVSSPAMDAARSASATLDWLMQHGHAGLVREAHIVLSASRPGSASLKLDKVYEHFAARCRSIHMIPFDRHLAEGADVDFNLLRPATTEAYLQVAGAVAERFALLRSPYGPR